MDGNKGKRRGPQNGKAVIRRLMTYLFAGNRLRLAVVLLCIAISTAANVAGSMFIRSLIDD